MPNAAITTLITGLSVVTTDTTATNNFQDDVIFELARGAYPDVLVQTGAAFTATVAQQERYALPTVANGARTPLAIFYDTTQLLHLRKDEAWAYDEAWRDAPDPTVVGFVYDPEDRPNYSLVPPPTRAGATIGGNTPLAVTTWPEGNITVIFAQTDTSFAGTTYDDFKLPIALEVMAREFARDSDHQDVAFAGICRSMADLFFLLTSPLVKPV